eukprot:INCI9276.1.p1 GENE.INCI9276.1~~INCI9276.1.p1  ORF type:complete len:506 (+),score=73.00 INCI9276.1:149-1519(+)
MYNVVRNSLMPAAGVRGNLRDREPQMSSLLAWSAENDEEEEDAASSLANGSRREPLLGQAVRDRWESEAHQQFRYYTVNHATPVEEGNRLSHTHQYTQHTRHLEQQQQQQIQEFNQRRRPTVERHLHPHPHEGAPAVDEQENTNLGVVSAPSSGDTLASQPLVDSGPARGANARPLTAGPGGQRPKGNAKTAAAKHIERMQAARRRKNKANTARQPRVYTSREMPDSTAARKLKQAPFHAYGRGNTHPVTKEFLDGNYLKTHNLNVARNVKTGPRGALPTHPAIESTYEHALMASKISREELRAISDQARIEKLREADARLKSKNEPADEPVFYGRVGTEITASMRQSPPRVPQSYEPPATTIVEQTHRPLRDIYHGIHDIPPKQNWTPREDTIAGVDPTSENIPAVATWQPRHFDVERNPRYYRQAPTEFLGRIPPAGILARSEDRVSDLLYVFD